VVGCAVGTLGVLKGVRRPWALRAVAHLACCVRAGVPLMIRNGVTRGQRRKRRRHSRERAKYPYCLILALPVVSSAPHLGGGFAARVRGFAGPWVAVQPWCRECHPRAQGYCHR